MVQLGRIGLGRMGTNLVRRLMRAGQEWVVYDPNADRTLSAMRKQFDGQDEKPAGKKK